jgi:hypothetical protein
MEEERTKLEKLIALGWLIAAVVALAGCASKDIRQVNNLSVQVGETSTAIIGVPFVSHEYGTVESSSTWQGVAFGGMHHSTHRGANYKIVNIYYGGIQGSVVTLLYQETIGQDETPHISKPFTINLKDTDTINIRGYKVSIHEANQSSMQYTLRSKPRWDE